MKCWFPGCKYFARSDNVKKHFRNLHGTHTQQPSLADSYFESSFDIQDLTMTEVPNRLDYSEMIVSQQAFYSD
jgi:hypothetical protein